ncbi:actin related protein 2/3 complex putative (arpc1) (ARPC1) [Leptomonas seymouri]|uniref:Arp2/3 complex 41 kDa subunit n=1 Tax=Leptomonas seymouri TaxID=5684 RepID=A0A0N0P8H8_LEPSE|nr:actin related protein 2/3 complex putative (arpc1) (ARPC1) [Leptomonas seymouri]|eukprot:KPI89966.1 actin related protein 2/3 complex putative (arpc1) (ARPC1) [Leptomonas seymouri]
MAQLHCLSSSYRGDADGSRGSSSTLKLAALTFNADGTQAAYAVRRSPVLTQGGIEDPAHCIFIERTRALHTDASAAVESASSVLSFSDWVVIQVLKGVHTSPITALSWCSRGTGALVSASADRCVYVWAQNRPYKEVSESAPAPASPWQDAPLFHRVPQLVMLSTEVLLSPTSVSWSVHGSKLYIGTAGGNVAVGRYDTSQRWWICRTLLNARLRTSHCLANPSSAQHHAVLHTDAAASAAQPQRDARSMLSPLSAPRDHLVVSVVPHPSHNAKVAVALLNGTVQVLSTHMKAVDGSLQLKPVCKASDSTDEAERTCSNESHTSAEPFGHVYLRFSIPCWLYGLSWSPSGAHLAVVGHDSVLHLWHCAGDRLAGHTALRLRTLPLVQCAFASDERLVAAGFEGRVYVFGVEKGGAWHLFAEGKASDACEVMAQLVPTVKPSPAVSAATRRHVHLHETKATVHHIRAADETHEDVCESDDAVVDARPNAISLGQHAFELMEKGGGRAPCAIAASTPTPLCRGEDIQQPAWRTSNTPIRLLVPVCQVGGPAAASGWEKNMRRNASVFVSASGDGRVQVWGLDHNL